MDLSITRRQWVAAGAAGAALLPLRRAAAQTVHAGGDWLQMVRTHHALLAKTFESILAARDRTYLARDLRHRTLSHELTAHSVAEENVLYPALARSGMLSESDRLYLDQAHAKVTNAEIMLLTEQQESAWFDKVRELQAMVMKHALQDEEASVYPALKAKLDAATNQRLTLLYAREFAAVGKPRT